MGYTLEGGPRDGQYVEELPSDYVAKGITSGVVAGVNLSPAPRAVYIGSPKERYREQVADDEYGNLRD